MRGYKVPGLNPDSEVSYGLSLGNAAHRLIAYMYKVSHPESEAYYNKETIFWILTRLGVGEPSRLLPSERNLRPDITDTTTMSVFEIKPWNEQGLLDGRKEVQTYLVALNRAVEPEAGFSEGRDFQGETLIHFAQGQFIWRLEWRTTEPGVLQYKWTRSQQRFESEVAAYEAGRWVELTEQEMRQFGGWVGQAVEGMISRREQLTTFSGTVGIVIDVVGTVATGFFSGAIFSRMGSGAGAQEPPAQGGGKVIPFLARSVPATPPARVPAAGGMSLPH